jgi:hypothetical protein
MFRPVSENTVLEKILLMVTINTVIPNKPVSDHEYMYRVRLLVYMMQSKMEQKQTFQHLCSEKSIILQRNN